jgi:hypothetical protein
MSDMPRCAIKHTMGFTICKALFDCDYKLDCWPDCSQIVQ